MQEKFSMKVAFLTFYQKRKWAYHGVITVMFMEDDLKIKSVPNVFNQNLMKKFSENNISDKNKESHWL